MRRLRDKKTLLIDDVLLIANQKVMLAHLCPAFIVRRGPEADLQRGHVEAVGFEVHRREFV
jgi:hypothetical protein